MRQVWLEGLKPGDVVEATSRTNEARQKTTVKAVSKTLIYTNVCKFRRSDGIQKGSAPRYELRPADQNHA